jgi:hypothetical protein
MVKTVTGYKFNNKAAFNSARGLANNRLGIPVNDEAVTRNYFGFSVSYKEDLETIDFYYVSASDGWVLGFPTEFEIREKNEEPII